MKWMPQALVLTMGLLFAGSGDLFAQGETYGTMMVVKGDIKVTSAKAGKTDPAKVGFKVYAGDTIVAGADSRAKIVMSDKDVLNISPDSKITIAKYENNGTTKNVELKVDYGKVRASVEQQYDGDKSKFNIRTPTAVAGVRGTDFITGFNPQSRKTQVVTFSGVVAVGTAGANGAIQNAVFVRPGQSTSVGDGQLPEAPKAMPKDQVQEMNMDSTPDAANAAPEAAAPVASDAPAAKEADAAPVADKAPVAEAAAPTATADAPAAEAKKDTAATTASGSTPSSPATAAAPTNAAAPATAAAPSMTTSTNSSGSANSTTTSGTSSSKTTTTSTSPTPMKTGRTPGAIDSLVGPTMVDARDLSPSIAKTIQVPTVTKVPTVMIPQRPPTLTGPVTSPLIDNVIKNTKSKVTVTIQLPGQ